MDFTYKKYRQLIEALANNGYRFVTFEEFVDSPNGKVVILRHDIDRLPGHALETAYIESSIGAKGSYHFRINIGRKAPWYVKDLISSGHEIAYHYEDLSAVSKRKTVNDKSLNSAFSRFKENLSWFRNFYPVKVISMHGDPISGVDNRDLWKVFDYRNEGIICEPYFDIDYSSVLYLTDTGRKWNADKSNIRDRIIKGMGITLHDPLSLGFSFSATDEIISAIKTNSLPGKIIINTHPQRWNGKTVPWVTELVVQNLKNIVKFAVYMQRH